LTLWNGTEQDIEDPYRFPPILTDFDLHLHGEGTHFESYKKMGAHLSVCDAVAGVRFAVWAPNALVVSVIGDFNEWDSRRHPMRLRTGGIWEIFLPEIGVGTHYKYQVRSRFHGYQQQKSDQYGFASEAPPKSASIVADLKSYEWGDDKWQTERASKNYLKEPFAVYEVHLGSWLRGPHNTLLTY